MNNFNEFSDFKRDRYQENPSNSRYQVIRELGRNRENGRITYLANDTRTRMSVTRIVAAMTIFK